MAQPELNSNEFIRRYNDIEPREGVFRLRRLSNDASADFQRTNNPVSGLIWANCELDLGNIQSAKSILNRLITADMENYSQSTQALLNAAYARLLGSQGFFDNAVNYLDKIFDRLASFGEQNLSWISDIYAEAGRKEAVIELQQRFNKLYPESGVVLNPAILFYALESNDIEVFAQLFFAYAESLMFSDTNLDNLDSIIDKMGDYQTHPGTKPNLSDAEYERLECIKSAMQQYLKEEEAWEKSVITELEQEEDSKDKLIPFEQVVKDIGLENCL